MLARPHLLHQILNDDFQSLDLLAFLSELRQEALSLPDNYV